MLMNRGHRYGFAGGAGPFLRVEVGVGGTGAQKVLGVEGRGGGVYCYGGGGSGRVNLKGKT